MTILTPEKIAGENLIEISKRIATFTPPIFLNGAKRPEPISSSILVKWDNDHYFVTAAHTLKNFDRGKIGIISNRTFLRAAGRYFTTKSDSADNDKIDIGVYQLTDEYMKQLGTGYQFYDLKSFDFDHQDSNEDDYLIVGHPISRSKVRPDKNKIELRPFLYRTNLNKNQELFVKTNTNPQVNLLLNYDKNNLKDLIPNSIVQGPEPNGLSGCGIWRISNPVTNDVNSIKYYPAGMIIEYYREHKILIGTRMKIITQCIKQAFESEMTQSKSIRINLR